MTTILKNSGAQTLTHPWYVAGTITEVCVAPRVVHALCI